MEYQNIILEQRQQILLITINREAKLNALNKATLTDLNSAIIMALKDNSVKGIIVTGAGKKAFVAGADIAEFKGLSSEEGYQLAKDNQEHVFNLIANSPKPFIAAINGFALGGGLELALASHLRIASDNAKMGLPEVSLGLIPGYGGTQRLTELIGKGKAMEMILTGEMISADEGLRVGLINSIHPLEDLVEAAEELLNRILKNSPNAVKHAIRAINAASANAQGFETEITAFGKCFDHKDFTEGVEAFLEKRKPRFHNGV
ncbi:enoyl-CoA hydratase/isomerase family protein [Rubrolithibacter danxiaensis]|uniref:enoyl-CoA hydratase/isomerase family protein n=1 Tax=Rubrolithibacter danxiaensis TaxID=3390805 RepID=UPI003BF90E0B